MRWIGVAVLMMLSSLPALGQQTPDSTRQVIAVQAAADSVRFEMPQDTTAASLTTVQTDTLRTNVRTAGEQNVDQGPQTTGLNQEEIVGGVEDDGVQRLEIDGLIVDETLSKIGRDFYDYFYSRWQAPPDAVNFTVTITEQPVPGLGTRVLVKVNDELVFQAQLQPREELIENAAQQAIYYTAGSLQRRGPTTMQF